VSEKTYYRMKLFVLTLLYSVSLARKSYLIETVSDEESVEPSAGADYAAEAVEAPEPPKSIFGLINWDKVKPENVLVLMPESFNKTLKETTWTEFKDLVPFKTITKNIINWLKSSKIFSAASLDIIKDIVNFELTEMPAEDKVLALEKDIKSWLDKKLQGKGKAAEVVKDGVETMVGMFLKWTIFGSNGLKVADEKLTREYN